MGFGRNGCIFFRAKDHLGDALAIAQVDENHAAVIATHMHPAGQNDLLSDVGCCQLIAVVSPIHGEEKALILGEAQNLASWLSSPSGVWGFFDRGCGPFRMTEFVERRLRHSR